jgi:hypothetical protein
MIAISTAGTGADSPLGKLRTRALAQPVVRRKGSVLECAGPTVAMLEWSVPPDANVDDARVVKKANPQPWVSVQGLAEMRAAVQDVAYRRFMPTSGWRMSATGCHTAHGRHAPGTRP